MKLSALAYALVSAGLATQVVAAPLRVVVVENISTPVHVGGSTSNNSAGTDGPVAHLVRPDYAQKEHKPHHRGGCMKGKQLSWMNSVRKAFGLPLIEPALSTEDRMRKGTIQIIPIAGGNPTFIDVKEGKAQGGEKVKIITTGQMKEHQGGHLPPARPWEQESFLRRVHFALTALGPWEGRAVAFVLGCGIGVLLRMVWVLAIVCYRAVRGASAEEREYEHLVFAGDAEEIFVAPPNYSAQAAEIDEKAPVLEAQN